MTDASQLLNLLRGVSSPPATSSAAAPALSPTAATSPPAATSDVDRLFAAFASPHPSTTQRSTSPSFGNPSQSRTAAITSPLPASVTDSASTPHSASASTSLLSLLQRMGSPSAVMSSTPSNPQLAPESPPLPGPQPRKSLDASTLLARMSQPPPDPSAIAPELPVADGQRGLVSPAATEAGLSPPPAKFSNFVSPFDALEQSYAKDQAIKANKQAASDEESARSTPVNRLRDTLSPAPGARLASTRSVASSDAGELTPSHEPSSPAVKQKLSPRTSLLAHSYLPAATSEAEPNDTVGLRLPRNDAIPQTLTIDISDKLLDSLSTEVVTTTPVALFNVVMKRPAGQIVGVWDRGFVYATSKGKARVIDKDSGTRVLLKAHKMDLIDLQVAKKVGPDGTRSIVTISQDDKLILWMVPNHCTEATASFTRSPELLSTAIGSDEHWQVVRLHPLFPEVPIIIAGTNRGKIVSLKAPKELGAPFDMETGLVHELGSDSLVDIDFSPDGSAFAALASSGVVTVCRTENIQDVLTVRDLSKSVSRPATAVKMLSDHDCRPSALAVLSREGCHGQLLSLHQSKDAAQTAVIEFLGADSDDVSAMNFGSCAYYRPSNTLYWSSSVRGSLFAFKLAYPDSDRTLSTEAQSDADFLKLLQDTCTVDGRPPRIDHVIEVPSPAPVISYALEDLAAAEGSALTFGALVAFPGGVHQIHFEQPCVPISMASPGGSESPIDSADDEAHLDKGRRMSLESAIHVSSEVEIAVDEIDPVTEPVSIPDTPALPALGLSPAKVAAVSAEPAVSPVAEEAPTLASDAGHSIDRDSTATPTGPGTATSAINAAIKTMKAAKRAQAEQQQQQQQRQRQHTPEAANRDLAQAASPSGKDPTPADVPSLTPVKHSEDASDSSLKEIRKLTMSLPSKIAGMVEAEFEKHVYRLEEQRHVDSVDEKARQESLLKVMSSQLTKHTNKLVEQTLNEELVKLAPIIENSTQRALTGGFVETLQAGFRKSLQHDVEHALSRSDVLRNLDQKITSRVEALMQPLARDELARQARSEAHEESVKNNFMMLQRSLLDLQKELVQSYSTNARLLETMSKMQDNMSAMQRDLQQLGETVASLQASSMASAPSEEQAAVAATVKHDTPEVASAALSSPDSAQANLSVENLEATFTEMLQPVHEPAFADLQAFIRSSTPRLLDQIMPVPSTGARPALSNAVLLSLTLRISQLVARETARHSQENAVEGHWLLRCVESLDPTQTEIQQYGGKIAEWVTNGLQARQATLVKLGDIIGVQQIGALSTSIKARLEPLASLAR
ncbi:hypothetical protein OIV83_005165 [Microbotryomycetes sp. JL201]|nr:hypothetical protein OIV83_005165 [Microbotryomycetes sp. JL201]